MRTMHGIDVSKAATLEESYFEVIASLLRRNVDLAEKNLELLTKIESKLAASSERKPEPATQAHEALRNLPKRNPERR